MPELVIDETGVRLLEGRHLPGGPARALGVEDPTPVLRMAAHHLLRPTLPHDLRARTTSVTMRKAKDRKGGA